jgi:riboflavin-specific deaminase-like protein
MSESNLQLLCYKTSPSINHTTNHAPYLTVSLALTINGVIAQHDGSPLKISNPLCDRFVHHMRSEHDVIVVSANTIQSDNPLLNVRHVNGKNPDVIILDRVLKTPTSSKVFDILDRQIHIFTAKKDRYPNRCSLTHHIRESKNGLDIREILQCIQSLNYKSVLFEAGPTLFKSLIIHGVNQIILSIAPFFAKGRNIYTDSANFNFLDLDYINHSRYSLDGDTIIVFKAK